MIPLIIIHHHKGVFITAIHGYQAQHRMLELEKVFKRVLFKADFVVFWAQKEVVEATKRVQNTLDSDQRCLPIILVGFNANGPLHGHPRHPNFRQKAFFGPFLTDFET